MIPYEERVDYLGRSSALLGGWFNDDGQSLPTDGPLTDGWFGEATCPCDYLRLKVEEIERSLLDCEPVYIDDNGHLHEIDIDIGNN